MFVGMESLDEDSLEETHKPFNRVQKFAKEIEMFHKYGIMVIRASCSGSTAMTSRSLESEPWSFSQVVAWNWLTSMSSRRYQERFCMNFAGVGRPRVRAVLRRGAEPDELVGSTVEAGPVRVDIDRHVVSVNGQPVALPLKELTCWNCSCATLAGCSLAVSSSTGSGAATT